jgi:perosamine synthetase
LIDEKKFGMSRDELMKALLAKNIETRPFFYPLPKLPPYKKDNQGKDFPNTYRIADQGMNVPSFASLSTMEVQYICDAIINK